MQKCNPGTATHAFLEMDRITAISNCKRDLKDEHSRPSEDACKWCYSNQLIYEFNTGDTICTSCGSANNLLHDDKMIDSLMNHACRSRYTQNNIHRYCSKEHFFQCLLDITCNGNRNTPIYILDICKDNLLGKENLTSNDVFDVLQSLGLRKYYNYKYDICRIINGKREIIFNANEMDRIRIYYMRYDRHFLLFQRENNIGSYSRKGRLRVYWPMKYIMLKMFLYLNRIDAIRLLRKVSNNTKLKEYDMFWDLLTVWVDHAEPKAKKTVDVLVFPIPRQNKYKGRKEL
jgi:hypothetical protein